MRPAQSCGTKRCKGVWDRGSAAGELLGFARGARPPSFVDAGRISSGEAVVGILRDFSCWPCIPSLDVISAMTSPHELSRVAMQAMSKDEACIFDDGTSLCNEPLESHGKRALDFGIKALCLLEYTSSHMSAVVLMHAAACIMLEGEARLQIQP